MKSIFFGVIIICTLAGCGNLKQESPFAAGTDMITLAMPFRMEGIQSVLHLDDYFTDPQVVDSVTGREGLSFHLDKNTAQVVVTATMEHLPLYSEIKFWVGGKAYSVLIEKAKRAKFVFTFDPKNKVYRDVRITGQMNNWNRNATPLSMKAGVWQAELDLNPGRYQYLLILDGIEGLDPNNPEKVDNNIGGFNSVLTLGQTNFKGCPELVPRSFNRNKIIIDFNNAPDKIYIFWQNFRLPVQYIARHDDNVVIQIPAEAQTLDRSFIRLWSYNDAGTSNNLLIPLQKGKVVTSSKLLTRQDKEASILYFLMVDRFNNGNRSNDQPIDDPDILPPANYWGGDLEGITNKVYEGYFSNLGVNSIWLSPITQNPLRGYVEYPAPHRKYSGYHGYWPVTLTTVDHRFGTSADMHALVRSSHARGINLLLDYVSNHVHEENQLYKNHPGWATPLNLPDGRKNIRLWDEFRLTTWFDTFMPSLNHDIIEVVETISDSAVYWIKEYDLDGFRHDATKHVPEHYWRTLTRKLKKEITQPTGKRLYQIGETFGSRELIGSYVSSGELDGQFDFNLYFDARSIFALDHESFVRMNQSLMESFTYYGTTHLMGNITGNHDLPRFISYASGDLKFGEDQNEAAWTRKIGVTDTVGYYKLSMLTAFIMTIPGVPVIYYGDEIGLPGAGDPDSRRPMKFNDLTALQQKTKEKASRMANLRKNRLSLLYGNFDVFQVDDQTWVYGRTYFDEFTLVAFNKGSSARQFEIEIPDRFGRKILKSNFGAVVEARDGKIKFTLPPYSFEVIGN